MNSSVFLSPRNATTVEQNMIARELLNLRKTVLIEEVFSCLVTVTDATRVSGANCKHSQRWTNTFWCPPMQWYIGQQATELWAGKLQSITVKLRWRHLWPDKHPSCCCFSSLDNSSGKENKWLGRICSVWKFASLKQLRHAMLLWCLLFWVGVILIRNAWGELARKKA